MCKSLGGFRYEIDEEDQRREVSILIQGLEGEKSVSEICRRNRLNDVIYYK